MQFPFIYVRRVDGGFAFDGQTKASLGTPVKFGSTIGGIFANWEWRDDDLTAEVDPYGIFSLFYSETKDGLMLSKSPIQLIALGANPEIDQVALAVFHMLGWYINEDTPFKHIKILPPNGRLLWRNGTLSITRRSETVKQIQISKESAISEYARLFSDAVKSCWASTNDPVIIPLSGGRDSRHILLESARQGFAPDHCVTYDPLFGSGFDPEWECAKQLTELFSIDHQKIKTLQSKHADQLTTIVRTHLGTDEHVQQLALARHLKGKTCLDGIAGDTLSRAKHISNDLTLTWDSTTFVDKILKYFDLLNGNSAIDRGVNPDFIGPARLQIVECFEQYSQQPDPYSHFFFWQRTRREIGLAPGALLSTAKAVLCPYLDPSLAEFCLSVPADVMGDGKFHDHVIRHSFPDCRVPYHDELKTVLTPPPIQAKVRSVIDAVHSKLGLGLGYAIREPFRQIRMLTDPRQKKLYVWKTYQDVLKKSGTKTGALRLLQGLNA